MSESAKHSRRAALGVIVGASSLAIGPAAARASIGPLSIETADDMALALWERRQAFRQPVLDANRAYEEARSRMPWWALSGPSELASDGSLTGPESGWPAMQGVDPSPHFHVKRLIRPSPEDLRKNFDHRTAVAWGGNEALKAYRQQLRELAARRKAKRDEEKLSGLSAADAALETLYRRLRPIELQIEALPPKTPNAAAARIFLEAMATEKLEASVSDSSVLTVAAIALEHLRPASRGIIKAHVDDLLDNPDRRIASCQAYVGDHAAGGIKSGPSKDA
jgi:hypothetical protein